MPSYIRSVTGALVEKTVTATLPTPSSATDGVDISSWRTSSQIGYTQAVIALRADGAATVTSPKLYAYGAFGTGGAYQWHYIGDLNGGTAISLTAALAFAQVVQFPCAFTRLAVGGTVSANSVGYTATPMMVTEQ